jgi:lipoprotein-anchoring transpeptidase ErfK/SrfK
MKMINRRDFIKLSAAGLGALLLPAAPKKVEAYLPQVDASRMIGRVLGKVEVKSKPDPNSTTVEVKYDDDLIPYDREIIGLAPSLYSTNRLWYETPNGYIPSIRVQPTKMDLNEPVAAIPTYGETPGMWAEVSVPYVDIYQDNPPARSQLLREMTHPRFYYSQIFWVDGVKTADDGTIMYHVIERHGSEGDTFWAEAKAFRPITPDDVKIISPDVEDKQIIVDVSHQTISCFENGHEILFDRVSTGAKYNIYGEAVDFWSTPVGDYHVVNRKYVSLHMAGGSAATGYELFGVSWTSIFATGGVAIHSTYWHNNYGEPMSHGCVNVRPDVARFVFQWTLPFCDYDPGKIEVQGYSGTKVRVIEY